MTQTLKNIVPPDYSLFAFVEQKDSQNIFTNNRRSLIQISKEIEDGVLHRQTRARIFAGFQKLSFFVPHIQQYQAIAAVAESIWVFGVPDSPVPEIPGVNFVLLDEDDRLAGEWFLIAEAQDYLSGLIAQDLSGFDVPSDERKFRGLWTFDANMVNRLQENLSRLLSIEPLHYDSRNHNYDGQMRQIAHVTSSLIEDLEKRNANLEHWQTLRRDLVSMIVHDLRNPLSVISGYLELIERAIRFGEPAEQILSFVKKAQTGSFELSNLIDDILDLNRLVAGDFPFEPESVAVLPLFEEMFQQYTILAQRRRLSINMELEDPMLTVYADRQTLKRILANLMSNAFRHTETGGVTLEAEACEGAGIQLGVVDTGEGIPAESLPHIFDQFYQVRGKGRKRGTSGLGLAFCKRAVEAQGGEIWVESTLGQGTGFYFCLPAVEENVPAADAVGSET